MPPFIEPVATRHTTRVVRTAAGTAAANTAVVVTLAAVAGYRHYLAEIIWSYDGEPTGGRLTVSGIEGDDVDVDITAAGPGPLFLAPLAGEVGAAVVVTLAAGGASVVGKLNVHYATMPGADQVAGLAIA